MIPIHKSGSSTCVNNYRPISTLSILSKLFEKLMKHRLTCYFESGNFFTKHQFGFRSGCDTNDAVLEFLDQTYKSLDSGRSVVSVFLDLSKAFQTLDHGILLSKLNYIGIRGEMLEWLRSYLSGRTQFTTVNGESSDMLEVCTGVPQGSVLGPLLFLVYLNDMSNSSGVLNFIHFADDTTLFLTGENLDDLCGVVNDELGRVDEWLITNKLSLNVNKTNSIIFSNYTISDNVLIKIRDVPISRVHSTKFLGIIIDDRLTFSKHVDNVCSKISKSIGIMYRLSSIVPAPVLLNVYYALVHSNLIYGISSWGGSAQIHLNRVRVLQRRAVRLCNAGGSSCMNGLGVLTVDKLYKYFCAIKLFQSVNLGRHEYFNLEFSSLLPSHSHVTRQVTCTKNKCSV